MTVTTLAAGRDWWEDPACPALPDPPKVPDTVELLCRPVWKGKVHTKTFYLARGTLPRTATLAVGFEIVAKGGPLTDVLIQFYRTSNTGTVLGSPYEFLVTYIPQGAKILLDGIRNSITMTQGSSVIDASHLVYRSREGHVFRWPQIDCGATWKVLVKWPNNIPEDHLIAGTFAAVKYV